MKHSTFRDKKVKFEENKGVDNFVPEKTLSANEMWNRAMAMGKLGTEHMRTNTHGDRARATAMMEKAKVAPMYLPDGTRHEIEKEVIDNLMKINAEQNKKEKKAKENEVINKFLEEQAKQGKTLQGVTNNESTGE